MNSAINIVIIEDNKAFAASLKKMIELSEHMDCEQIYGSAETCLDAINDKTFPEANIILLDLNLPSKNGLTLVPLLRQNLPETDIIILTSNDSYLTTVEAIRLGVSGYILKDSSISEIRSAIEEVHQGGSVIDPQLSRLVLNALSSENFNEENPLSKRECEVLELLAMGFVKKEVAHRMDISYRTVAQYTESIYKKLQVPNIAAAVATAIRKGLI